MVGLVVFGKDALLAAALVFQLGDFGRDAFQLDIEPGGNKAPKAIGCASQLCQGTFIGYRQREMRQGISGHPGRV